MYTQQWRRRRKRTIPCVNKQTLASLFSLISSLSLKEEEGRKERRPLMVFFCWPVDRLGRWVLGQSVGSIFNPDWVLCLLRQRVLFWPSHCRCCHFRWSKVPIHLRHSITKTRSFTPLMQSSKKKEEASHVLATPSKSLWLLMQTPVKRGSCSNSPNS